MTLACPEKRQDMSGPEETRRTLAGTPHLMGVSEGFQQQTSARHPQDSPDGPCLLFETAF